MPDPRPGGRHRGGVLGAALVACALLVLEDPGVLAVRARLDGPTLAVDGALAAAMVAYNYVASRYVVGVSSAGRVHQALAELDAAADAAAAGRRWRWALRLANPFRLIRVAAERVAAGATRAGAAAHRRRLARTGRLLGDLAAVNLLGVPGVGIERAARGRAVARADSLRHALLFVASWFAGANLVEAAVRAVGRVPLVGGAADDVVAAIGRTFAVLTDVTAPVGAVVALVVFGSVLRLAHRVDRLAATAA